jgi:hypothetical protein
MPAPAGAYGLISSRQFVQPGSVTFGASTTASGSLTFNMIHLENSNALIR